MNRWSTRPEGGGETILRALVRLSLWAGPGAAGLLAQAVAGWFLLFDGPARRASAAYLRRALLHPPGIADVWRHFRAFALAIADRVFLLAGSDMAVETAGLDEVDALARAGQGCILLGAHLGSFEALRAVGRRSPVSVRALMFRDNEGALTRVLEALDPGIREAVIPIGRPDAMLAVRDCLSEGGMVGMLADRTPRGEREVSVPFLGAPAAFPAGPFVVAALLDAPVFVFTALRVAPRRYRITFTPFADRIVLRRAHRSADLHDVVARFAAWLEPLCRQHPYDWFNFFPFWPDPAPDAHRHGAVPAGLGTAG